jgi:hypothetical protein
MGITSGSAPAAAATKNAGTAGSERSVASAHGTPGRKAAAARKR